MLKPLQVNKVTLKDGLWGSIIVSYNTKESKSSELQQQLIFHSVKINILTWDIYYKCNLSFLNKYQFKYHGARGRN